MKKKVFALAMGLLMTVGAMAQSVVSTTATIEDVPTSAYMVSVQKEEKTVQKALEQYLKDAGLKTKKVDGYTHVPAQVIPAISESPTNFYARVEEQGKRNNKQVVITMLTLPNNENVARYLEDFARYIDRYEAQVALQAEEKNLDKAQKELSKATSAIASIDKAIESNNNKIASKQKDIENYKAKIKECEEDITHLQNEIAKQQNKREEAVKNENSAKSNVSKVEGEVEKYRALTK